MNVVLVTIFRLLLILVRFLGLNTWVFRIVCTRHGAWLYDIRTLVTIRVDTDKFVLYLCNNLPVNTSQLSEYTDYRFVRFDHEIGLPGSKLKNFIGKF